MASISSPVPVLRERGLVDRRARTGGKWEGLFLRAAPDGTWELLCQTRGRLHEGETILVEPGPLQLTLLRQQDGYWLARPQTTNSALELLEKYGRVPLP